MKTFVKTIAIAVISVMTFAVNAADNNSNPAMKAKTFEVGMYQSVNSLKMNVIIEKTIGKELMVALKDENGSTLYQERVSKNETTYHGKFDLSQLKDGKYTFVFTKGEEKITKQVSLGTQQPTESNRLIVVQ